MYKISPSIITDLVAVIGANFGGSKSPVVVHSMGVDNAGYFLVNLIAASASPALSYARALCASAERGMAMLLPARNQDSKHIGVIGERLEFKGSLYHVGAHVHENYGTHYIHRIGDENGNEITWNTTRIHPLGEYDVMCRVKEHVVYRGVKQTAVTHCKFSS